MVQWVMAVAVVAGAKVEVEDSRGRSVSDPGRHGASWVWHTSPAVQLLPLLFSFAMCMHWSWVSRHLQVSHME